jgi:hypothetical protein
MSLIGESQSRGLIKFTGGWTVDNQFEISLVLVCLEV